jgi:hypothetical protein
MKRISYILLIAVLFASLGIIGCGDDSSTGPDPEEAPSIPEITAAQPDFSYFENASKAGNEMLTGDAFGSAQNTANSAEFLFSFGQLGTTYFNMAENEEPEFEDGEWVWSYSASFESQTLEFKLTASVNESANEVDWAYFISSTGGEQEFEEYRFMEGTTSLDGSSGNWQINDYPEESTTPEAVMSYEWDINDDDELTATFTFHNEDDISTISYVEDGSTHTLTINGSNSDLELYWDTQADHGYWWDKDSGDQLCWDASKEDIACSDIGF